MAEALDLRTQSRLGAAFALLAESGGTGRADGMAKGVQFGATVGTAGPALTKGQLVKSAGTDDIGPGARITVTTAAGDQVIGVALEAIAAANGGAIGVIGIFLVQTTGTVAVWDVLYASSTTGRATATPIAGATAIGRSLNAASGSDTVWALVNVLSNPTVELGSMTADGSPVTVSSGADHRAFPGVVALDGQRFLAVFRHGTDHAAGGNIVGRIGTWTGPTTYSLGSEFTIYDHATLDVRCEDSVSIVDGRVVIYARLYDGTNNNNPFLLLSDDGPSDLTSASSWTNVSVPLTFYSTQNISQGHVTRLQNGQYLAPFAGRSGTTFEVGVLTSASLTDWSAMTRVVTATSTSNWSEIAVEELPDGTLMALIRSQSGTNTHRSTSTDHGTTWSATAVAHDGFGYPMFRRLISGLVLSVYRDAPDGDTAWRFSTDEGVNWGTETILDTTGTRNVYATLLQRTETNILCLYAVEGTGSPAIDADIYSQVFTDSSSGFTYHGQLAGVGPDQHHPQDHELVSSDHFAAGLTASHVLTATSATAFAFQAPTSGENVQKSLTNKSGGTVNKGDLVVVDETTNESFTTTTTLDAETSLGIVQGTIANNAAGAVALVGYVDLTNTADISWSRGDYVYAGSNAKIVHGSNTRVPGALGQFLKAGSNSSAWLWGAGDQTAAGGDGGDGAAAFVGVKAYHNATQTITTATNTAASLDSEDYDSDAIHDNVTNNSRFTVPAGKDGKWRFGFHVMWDANATGVRVLWIEKNGSAVRGARRSMPANSATTHSQSTEIDVDLAAGDYIEFIVFQNSGTNRTIGAAGNSSNATTAWAEFLGA